jgi:membrane-associated protease RseP (regulator of RpoE activity)
MDVDEDHLRVIVERHFRIYDDQEEKVQGDVAARMFFIMFNQVDFDAHYEAVRKEIQEFNPELLVFIRRQGGEDVLFVADRPPAGGGGDIRKASLLLALTFVTTTIQGALFWKGFSQPGTEWSWGVAFSMENLLFGFLFFALPLMAILIIHESAHFIAARRHGLRPSFPFFIPLPPPIGYFGTLGAFIRMRDPLPDRRSLFDVGASGPIAGFIVAVPIIVLGALLTSSAAVALPDTHDPIFTADGFSVDYSETGEATFTMDPLMAGVWLIQVESPEANWTYVGSGSVMVDGVAVTDQFGGTLDAGQANLHSITVPEGATSLELVVTWDDGLIRFGDPLLVKGLDAFVGDGDYLTHPLFFAGWVGIFITGLNLLPLGQLDGGHVSRAVFGERARNIGTLTIVGLVILSFWFQMWLILALIVFFFMGADHPPPLNDRTRLDSKRKAIAVLVLLIFIVSFIPMPLII